MQEGLLVTGARDWSDARLVEETLRPYSGRDIVLIHGDCVGLDRIAANSGEKLGFRIEPHPADWRQYGRGAGPVRNKAMVDRLLKFKVRHMFAFHDNIELSKGTKNCVQQARKAGVCPVIVQHPLAAEPGATKVRRPERQAEIDIPLTDADLKMLEDELLPI